MNTDTRLPIRYRDFWDVPRIFLANYRGHLFLFDCPFDEEVEDYPELYHVYVLPPLQEEELSGSWADFAKKAIHYLGDIAIDAVQFDPSKRKEIDVAVLQQLADGRPMPVSLFDLPPLDLGSMAPMQNDDLLGEMLDDSRP